MALTAGASAPEELVQECVRFLVDRFQAVVEERVIRNEDMHFQLPAAVRRMQGGRKLPATA